jgi:hypothetical protein
MIDINLNHLWDMPYVQTEERASVLNPLYGYLASRYKLPESDISIQAYKDERLQLEVLLRLPFFDMEIHLSAVPCASPWHARYYTVTSQINPVQRTPNYPTLEKALADLDAQLHHALFFELSRLL